MGTSFSKNGNLSGSIIEDQYNDKLSLYNDDVNISKNIVDFAKVAINAGTLTIDASNYGYYGTVDNKTSLMRIANLSLNASSAKTYTVSFYIKGSASANVNIDLCDATPITSINVTTAWKKVVFTANVTNYYNSSLGYNGFLDITTSSTSTSIYVKNLKIEEGTNTNPIFTPYESDATSVSNMIEIPGLIEY